MQVDVLKDLGMRIRFLRTSKHMSIEDLALEADVNKNYLSDLERGTRNPTVKVLYKLSKALDEDLSNLFKGI